MSLPQPLHIKLKQYRVMSLFITAFFMTLTWDMWEWFQVNHHTLKDWTNASFSSLALLAAGAVKWSLENMAKRHEKDDHDD